jgi:multisubunit Na+/H+ antiporter MnhG subunit
MQPDDRVSDTNDRYRKVSRYVFFGFVAVATYFLIAEHRAHIVPFFPFLFLAACLLMHLFHHGGHKHGGDEESKPRSRPPSSSGGSAHQH